MPQIAKGGKWVFGWVVLDPTGKVHIPPEAYTEYGFQSGDPVAFLAGSRRSGGFGVARQERLAAAKILEQRVVAKGIIAEGGCVTFPTQCGLQPGERLLVVRGSGLALGFLQRGPIYEEAARHPEVEVFSV